MASFKDELLEKLLVIIRRKHDLTNEFIIEATGTPLTVANNYKVD